MCRDHGTPGFRFLGNVLEQNDQANNLESIASGVGERSRSATKINLYVSEMNLLLF